jgi:hypothetical protein
MALYALTALQLAIIFIESWQHGFTYLFEIGAVIRIVLFSTLATAPLALDFGLGLIRTIRRDR